MADNSALIQAGLTFAGVIIGSGIIQFFISRKDKQKEDAKKDSADSLRKELKDHLTEVNTKWKSEYCDVNREAILRIEEGHKKDWQEIQKAIEKLVENDNRFADSIEKMVEKQECIAQANVGMIHNTIIRFTDKIVERGSVTYEELATLDSLYVPYAKLGGNGECKRRYEDVNKLTKVSKEEAVKRDREVEAKKYEEIQKAIRTG